MKVKIKYRSLSGLLIGVIVIFVALLLIGAFNQIGIDIGEFLLWTVFLLPWILMIIAYNKNR
jgi:hypothetical protein